MITTFDLVLNGFSVYDWFIVDLICKFGLVLSGFRWTLSGL